MDHNAMSKRPMNLAIFLYAVEHVSRISRVLKQPGGQEGVTLGGRGVLGWCEDVGMKVSGLEAAKHLACLLAAT